MCVVCYIVIIIIIIIGYTHIHAQHACRRIRRRRQVRVFPLSRHLHGLAYAHVLLYYKIKCDGRPAATTTVAVRSLPRTGCASGGSRTGPRRCAHTGSDDDWCDDHGRGYCTRWCRVVDGGALWHWSLLTLPPPPPPPSQSLSPRHTEPDSLSEHVRSTGSPRVPCRLRRRYPPCFSNKYVAVSYICFHFFPLFSCDDCIVINPSVFSSRLRRSRASAHVTNHPHDAAINVLHPDRYINSRARVYMFSPEKTRTGTGGRRWYATCLGFKSKSGWSSLKLKVNSGRFIWQ